MEQQIILLVRKAIRRIIGETFLSKKLTIRTPVIVAAIYQEPLNVAPKRILTNALSSPSEVPFSNQVDLKFIVVIGNNTTNQKA